MNDEQAVMEQVEESVETLKAAVVRLENENARLLARLETQRAGKFTAKQIGLNKTVVNMVKDGKTEEAVAMLRKNAAGLLNHADVIDFGPDGKNLHGKALKRQKGHTREAYLEAAAALLDKTAIDTEAL